jgi:hypothetical protein
MPLTHVVPGAHQPVAPHSPQLPDQNGRNWQAVPVGAMSQTSSGVHPSPVIASQKTIWSGAIVEQLKSPSVTGGPHAGVGSVFPEKHSLGQFVRPQKSTKSAV